MIGLKSFHESSIRSKLVVSSVAVTTIALVLACTIFITYDLFTFRDSLARKLSTQAEIVGINSVSALLFNDPESATSTLRALRAEPQILAAAIFAQDGTVFARYAAAGHAAEIPVPPVRFGERRFERGHVILFRRIVSDDEIVGTVYIEADLAEMRTRVQQYATTALFVLVLLLGAAMFLSIRLQRTIAQPILELAATVRGIAVDKNYSVRAKKERDDETGVLVDSFNEMLAQIQQRDTALTLEIAERKRAEAALGEARDKALEASRLKTAFLANMSHEIRTPLNVILGCSGLIGDHLAEIGDGSQQALIEPIRRSSGRLLNTVHGILDISKIETDNFEIQPKRIEIAPFVERELVDFRRLAEEKGLSLTFEVDAPDAVVTFDAYCLSHAFMNLVDNAIKFTKESGVFVWLGRDGDGRLCLEVRDTGVGIDPSYLPHIFEAFSQEQSGSTRPFEGSGLGMALANKFVEMNGASISVESQKGKGTAFVIHFAKESEEHPIEPAEPDATTAVPAPSACGSPSGCPRPRILLIEDDVDSQQFMKTLLRGRYEVSCAASSEEARIELARYGSDVRMILMDVSLKSRQDGLSLTQHLRSELRWKTVPIIAITAHVRSEDRDRALGAGCTAYLPKPIDNRELLALMARLLERSASAGVQETDTDRGFHRARRSGATASTRLAGRGGS